MVLICNLALNSRLFDKPRRRLQVGAGFPEGSGALINIYIIYL